MTNCIVEHVVLGSHPQSLILIPITGKAWSKEDVNWYYFVYQDLIHLQMQVTNQNSSF